MVDELGAVVARWIVLASIVGFWSGAYAGTRACSRWLARDVDGAALAGVLRVLRRTGYVAVTLLVLAGWRVLDGDVIVVDSLAAFGVVGVVAPVLSAVIAVVLGTIWLGGVFAVTLGTVPYRRRAREYDLTHRFVARWLLSRGVGSLAAVVVAVLVVSLVPAGVPRFVATFTLAASTMLVLPYTLAVGLRARAPTDAETRVLADVLPEDVTLRVVDDRTRIGPAFAAGTRPGPRMVFVTRAVFDVCGADAVRAVVAHEVAHHRRGHVALRVGVVAAGVLPVLAALEFAGSVPLWVVALAPPYALGVAWVFRRTEFAADAAAARAVAPDALATAFDDLARHRLLFVDPPGATRLFAVHPTIAARKRRLATGR